MMHEQKRGGLANDAAVVRALRAKACETGDSTSCTP